MITREQLEMAALAAGKRVVIAPIGRDTFDALDVDALTAWRPHTDPGDAARLAVRLNIRAQTGSYRGMHFASAEVGIDDGMLLGGNCASSVAHDGSEPDKLRAYCEAVTLCAAAVGKRMEGGAL